MFLHNKDGKICCLADLGYHSNWQRIGILTLDRGWDNFDNSGPYWNFSNPRVSEWFLNEVAAEIIREANVQVSWMRLTALSWQPKCGAIETMIFD